MNRRNRWLEQLVKRVTGGKKIPFWVWPVLIVAMKIDDFFAWVWSWFQ